MTHHRRVFTYFRGYEDTYNDMEQSASSVASSSSASRENPHFYGNRNFVTVFTRAGRYSLSLPRWM